MCSFFFFQAEDGIRDADVTGVQTCALPIFPGRVGPLARVFDFVATAAPGVKEILTIGKICWEVREALEGRAGWDLVVVDAAATGHIVAQLGAPQAIEEL